MGRGGLKRFTALLIFVSKVFYFFKIMRNKAQENQEKLVAILYDSNDAIIIQNLKGKILLWNKGAEEIYGYKEKQAVGMNILKIIPKSKVKEAADFVKKLSQGKFVKSFETERITKDGKIVEIVLTSSVIKAGKEKLISIITTERDITEKKKGIKDLIESERRLKDVTRNVKDAIFSKDFDRKYAFVNPSAVQMIGLPESKIIGKTAEQIFDKKSAKIIRDFDERNLRGEDVNVVRKLNIRGKEFYLNTTQSPAKDDGGKIVGIVGTVRDVTKEKEQENELRYSKERYKTIFNSTPNAIVLLNKKGEVLSGNKRITDWLGYEVGDMIGRNILSFDFLPPESKNKVREKIKDKFAGKKVDSYELEFIDKKGEKRICLVSGTIIGDKRGEKSQDLVVISDITERKRLEDKIRKNERKFRLITENTDDLISVMTFSLNPAYTYVSPSIKKLFFYDPAELIGKHGLDYIHSEDKKHMIPLLKRYIKFVFKKKISMGEILNASETVEYRFRDKRGGWHFLESTVNLTEDKELLFVSKDITKKKEVEGALQAEKKKAEMYLRLAGVIIIALNKEGKITLINKKGNKILGYENGELIGKNWFNCCLSDKDKTGVKKVFKKLMKGEAELVEHYENHIKTKKGEKRLISWHNNLLKNEKEEIVGTISAGEDVTDKKIAKEKLEESERRLAEVTENALEWIWEVDARGMYTYSNKSVFKILGYKSEEIVGKKYFYDFFTPEERDKMKKETLSVFAQKASFRNFVNKNLHKDGSEVWFSTSGMPVLDKNGKLMGYRGIDLDITREKEIDKMKTDFISVASHQLKTPLTGVKWTTELLENQDIGPLNEKQKELVNQVHESNDRLLDLVSDLLDVSHIETGRKFDLVKSKIAVRNEIEKILKDEKLLIKKQSVKVVVDNVLDKNIKIFADQNKIRQAFHNVIVNAISYSKKDGKVQIGIKSKNNKNITFFVKDNGIGIPRKQQKRVYEKFFRGSNAIMQTDGTGLGLYIVKAIIEAHGGKTWFESSAKGTTFYLTLPITK